MTQTNSYATPDQPIGLGSKNAKIQVYIENTPPLPQYNQLTSINALKKNDIAEIARLTGNHWRKIFNVFAKLLFEYAPRGFSSWQILRDEYLLQQHSDESLIFSSVIFKDLSLKNVSIKDTEDKIIHIIMGKTYANKLGIDEHCYWLNENFAINEAERIIICPYFDYRQLSNIKISQMVQLIKQLEA